MYIVDTNVFYALGLYYRSRFPKMWAVLEDLVAKGQLASVKEVRRELESNCPYKHISEWVASHKDVFAPPNEQEEEVVAQLMKKPQYRQFVKKNNIVRGLPVADPFVIAAGRVKGATVVTMESQESGGARIPAACRELGVECIDLEEMLTRENVQY